jgi:ABC-type uncharacterized transport system permease subunit
MNTIGKKIDGVLDAVYGKKIQGRWIKVLITIAVIIMLIVIPIFLSTNLGYEKDKGFYLKPWDVKVEVKKSE